MTYRILRKKELLLLIGVCCVVLALSMMGAQKIATEVAVNMKSLPIYAVETKNQEKLVALGINCAWGNGDIEQILDILDNAKIKATFFVVGDFCDRYPETVKAIFDRGHEIGNHSDTHADMVNLSEKEIEQEIEGCSAKVAAITGKTPELFRCPSGSYNDTVIDTIVKLGYEPIQWSLDSLDWKGYKEEEMRARIVPKLTYGDILLFHNDTNYTAQALPALIADIQQAGYEFKTVGEMIYRGEYSVDVTGRQSQ